MILVIGGAFQGKRDFVRNNFDFDESEILFDFHKEVKKRILENNDVSEFLEMILSEKFKVIISDEVGCGIVPIEKADRQWREAVGRALCEIAKVCDEVWRVQCGIGMKIK